MKKLYLMSFFVFLISTGIFAQKKFFDNASSQELEKAKPVTKNIKKFSVFKLDEIAMRAYLQNAPMEFKNNGITLPLEIPMPDGSVEIFNMVESPTLSPEIAAQNPDIKTYTGNGTRDKKSVIRLSLTSLGFNAVILNVVNDAVYFESYTTEKSNIYFNYFTKDVIVPDGPKKSSCQLDPEDLGKEIPHTHNSHRSVASSVGSELTTFRLAMAADAEFVAHNGGTVSSGFAAVVAYVNRIKAFYRNELSVDFILVSGTNLIYTNAATDPYDNDNQVTMLNQNRDNCNSVIGVANYDIGHVWGYVGTSGGGVASLESVCSDTRKGKGVSGEGDLNSYSQVFMDQLVYHEMGHQFGMTHSYNSSIPVCTTRSADTSVEPGAGATIMSYGFTCGTDDYFTSSQMGPILQFHQANYEQAFVFMGTISCGVVTSTGNTAPVVVVPGSYTIPKSTPFALTGSATDANGDSLSYCWEGTNIGTITPTSSTLADTAQPPFFRTYAVSSSPTRIYPTLARILDGSNYGVGDKLPSVGVVTTHSFTVRDNNANGGGVSNAVVNVTVDGAIGPFLETTNLSGIYSAGSTKAITWSVNGTDVATPNVAIMLSTDGGQTFPTTLLATTANDGTEVITWPNVNTSTARIKVMSLGNIFFDISNVNFSIFPALLANVTGTNTTTTGGSDGTATSAPSGGAISFNYNAQNTFPGAPYNSTGSPVNTPITVATITVPALPAGTVINSATLNLTNVNAINGSFGNEVRVYLSGAYTLAATQLVVENGGGIISPNPAINLSGFPVAGGTIDLQFSETMDDPGIDATIDGAYITINYTKNGYNYVWSNVATTTSISALSAGTYSVTVTDAAGLTATGSYTVTDPAVSSNTITASTGSNGTVSPIGITAVAAGGSQTYTITANTCYAISSVLVDGVSVGAVGTYTFSNVTAAHTISASFVSTATDNVTTTSACGTYTWANNGQTYTASGTYTGSTSNCITEKLTLTITPTTDNITAVTACGTYRWSNNGQTYTTSGIYTGSTTNCVTQKLNLTISNPVTPTFTAISPICAGGNIVLPLTSNNGIVGTWSPAVNNLATTTYTFTPTAGQCASTTTLQVVVNTTAAPTGNASQVFNTSNPVLISNLAVSGTSVVWYQTIANAQAAVNPLASNFVLTSGSTYYATQTLNGCTSNSTLAVTFINNENGVTNISPAQCGATLDSYNSIVYANLVAGAQGYRFKVTNLASNSVVIKDYVLRNLYLNTLSNFAYSTSYSIQVAVKRNNIWEAYGASCTVTTPTAFTSVASSQCGITLSTSNTNIYANIVSAAKGYRFKVTNQTTNSVQIIDKLLRVFNFNTVTDYSNGTAYTVEVAVKNTNDTYLPYGDSCTIFTLGSAPGFVKVGYTLDNQTFKASAYPNPYNTSFNLDLRSSSNSTISVVIYDMIGKQLLSKEFSVSEIKDYQFGDTMPSGIYNIIISQDDTIQSLRMIKR